MSGELWEISERLKVISNRLERIERMIDLIVPHEAKQAMIEQEMAVRQMAAQRMGIANDPTLRPFKEDTE